jgi:hypothetical protein
VGGIDTIAWLVLEREDSSLFVTNLDASPFIFASGYRRLIAATDSEDAARLVIETYEADARWLDELFANVAPIVIGISWSGGGPLDVCDHPDHQ